MILVPLQLNVDFPLYFKPLCAYALEVEGLCILPVLIGSIDLRPIN